MGPGDLDSSENGAGEAPASIAIDTGSSCAILSRFRPDFVFFRTFLSGNSALKQASASRPPSAHLNRPGESLLARFEALIVDHEVLIVDHEALIVDHDRS